MSAVISECGLYRYRLDRDCNPLIRLFSKAPVFAYFGINPSTADASLDDATVRKWRGFTERNGGDHFIVGNVFSYRATDVKDLGKMANHVPLRGDDHSLHLRQIIQDADILVPCWGSLNKLPLGLRQFPDLLLAKLLRSGKPVLHFGKNADGTPRHPLMLGYNTPLITWTAR